MVLLVFVDPVETTVAAALLTPKMIRRRTFATIGGDDYGDEYNRGNLYYPVPRNNVPALRETPDWTKSSSKLSLISGRKSPPPPPPQRHHFNGVPVGGGVRHATMGKNIRGVDEQTKKLLVSQLANFENPVKIVNPLYESQHPTVRSLNKVSSADVEYATLKHDTTNDDTVSRRQRQMLADQLAQFRQTALQQRLKNNIVDYPKPYRSTLLNTSGGSDNGSNSDRSSSLSDSTLNSSQSGRNGALTNGSTTVVQDRLLNSSSLDTNRFSSQQSIRHAAVVGRIASYGTLDKTVNSNNISNGTLQKQIISKPTSQINGEVDSLSISSVDSKDSDYQELLTYAELPPMNSIVASGRLVSLRQNLQITVRQLCAYTTTNWRRREFLDAHLSDIRSMCQETINFLKLFVDFAAGSFVNMTRKRRTVDDVSPKKLAHLLRPLRRSLNLLDKLRQSLDNDGWSTDKFVRDINGGNDKLDQFIAIAKQTPEDVRQVASFIHANSTLVFTPASSELSMMNGVESSKVEKVIEEQEIDYDSSDEKGSLFDDYDFVDGKQSLSNAANGVTEIGNGNKSSSSSIDSIELCSEDRQILKFYAPQMSNHIQYLSNVIDEFLITVEKNEPPKVFVSNSRFVVLAAHKLIYIGDNVAQCLKNREIGDKIKINSDRMCEVLKFCVVATKQAALQYPAIPSVQTMVDSMVNVSQAAHELTLLINEVAKL